MICSSQVWRFVRKEYIHVEENMYILCKKIIVITSMKIMEFERLYVCSNCIVIAVILETRIDVTQNIWTQKIWTQNIWIENIPTRCELNATVRSERTRRRIIPEIYRYGWRHSHGRMVFQIPWKMSIDQTMSNCLIKTVHYCHALFTRVFIRESFCFKN